MRVVSVFPEGPGPASACGAVIEVMFTRSTIGLVADDFYVTGAAGVGAAALVTLSDVSAGTGRVWRLDVSFPPVVEALVSVALPGMAGQVMPPISPGAGVSVRVGTLPSLFAADCAVEVTHRRVVRHQVASGA